MNIVLPATLMLDWWDARLRVAGSSTLGWVTASLVLANTDHLRYRRGEALAHQASCLNLVTNAVMVWNTVYMAAAVEQLNAFSGGGRFAGRPGGIAADLLASPADSSDRSCTAGRCMVFHRGEVSPVMRVMQVS